MSPKLPLVLALLLTISGCSAAAVQSTMPATPLVDERGATLDARTLAAGAPWTVIIFFSRECHCLDEHDARIRDLYATYHPRGVQLLMVDPEVRASPESDSMEAARRGFPFPILVDRGGRLADALGAVYATYSVVVDAQGRVQYRGGFDSDKTHLRTDATPYVRNALDDLLAGRPPRVTEAKTLGCSLQTW